MKTIIALMILGIVASSTPKNNPCDVKSNLYTEVNKTANEKICFETVDSYDLDYIDKKNITIYGNLSFPDKKKNKYNAIILSHGSGGVRKYHNKYIELLNDNGFAVFQIDHYMGRNIKYDKTFSKVSGITFMNDSYKALSLLKTHPKIDKVAYIGWSQGGVGPILSHFKSVTDFIEGGKFLFDASIAIYPYCGFTFHKATKTNNPLLILTGNADDLTPEKACINIYNKFPEKITHISLDNARHGYDNPFLYFGFTLDKAPSLNIISDDCTMTISEKGNIKTLSGNVVFGPKESMRLLDECSSKGVLVKYNSDATNKTQADIIDFLNNSL